MKLTMALDSGCSEFFNAAIAAFTSSTFSRLSMNAISVTFGSPRVSVPVLSNTAIFVLWAISTLLHFFDQNPVPAPPSGADHDRSGRGKTPGARAGDDEDGNHVGKSAGKCPNIVPDDKCGGGKDEDNWHEVGRR